MTNSTILTLAVFSLTGWEADRIAAIRAEPVPQKRFDRAIDNMDLGIKNSQEILRNAGTTRELETELEETAGSAELALQSLRDTGKRPKQLTRQYKKGEVRTAEALRKMNSLIQALSVENQSMAEKARDRLRAVQEDFLLGVMDRK